MKKINKINIYCMVAGGPESHYNTEQQEHKSPKEHKREVLKHVPSNKGPEAGKQVHKNNEKLAEHSKKIPRYRVSDPEIAQKVDQAQQTQDKAREAITHNGVPPIDQVVSDKETANKLKTSLTRMEALRLRKMEKMDLPEGVDKQINFRTREEILKDVMKVKPETLDRARQMVLDENPELKGLSEEKIEALAREKIVEEKIKKLEQKVKDKDGNVLDKTQYDAILDKYPEMKTFDDTDPELTKQLISVYGTKLTSAYAKLLKGVAKDEIPKNLEDFDQFIREKFAIKYVKERKGDALADGEDGSDGSPIDSQEIVDQVNQNAHNADAVSSMAGVDGLTSKGNTFEKGDMTADKAKLKEIIDKLPADSKVRKMLQAGYDLIGINQKDPRIKNFLNKNGEKIDPAKTYWCRAFVNAELNVMGVKTNHSLSARDGAKSIGKEVNSKDMVPGDIVVVERKGKASDGSPGGHIGIFLGFDSSGHPIILGGNQHHSVTIKTETRNVIGFRRAMSDDEAEKIKSSMGKGGTEGGAEKKA